ERVAVDGVPGDVAARHPRRDREPGCRAASPVAVEREAGPRALPEGERPVSGVSVHVVTFGLPEKIAVLKDRELKRANKSAVSKAGTRGRSIVRATIPVK